MALPGTGGKSTSAGRTASSSRRAQRKSGGNIKVGAKIRRLRRERGWTQIRLADELGVSPSYLNLIEHNRRKVTVDLLLRLAETFGADLSDLAEDDEGQLLSDLMEVLSDDLFEELDITTTDVRELVTASPSTARAVLVLHDAYHKARVDARSLATQLDDDAGGFGGLPPVEIISDFLQANSNYFSDLEEEADRVRREVGIVSTQSNDALVDYLKTAHGVRVTALPSDLEASVSRRFDPDRKVLELSERTSAESRNFQLAHQIGLLGASPVIDMLLMEGRIKDPQAHAIGRVALANYFASALLMPYGVFLEAARNLRYDIELLTNRFGASFEQVCHRLTSLNRQGERGLPLHMLRVDIAGNISKRFSLSGLPIPRHSGACSRWNVYSAFLNPGVIQAQVSALPDGTSFFCIARTVRKGGIGYGAPQSFYSIGIGCEIQHAHEMVYSDGIDLDRPNPIGVSCRICDRLDCAQRANPPVHIRFQADENARGLSPYAPAQPGGRQSMDPGPTR